MSRRRREASQRKRAKLPDGVMANTAYMEIDGNTRAVVAGCKGILLYSEECVSLRTDNGIVTLYGRELEMGCLSTDGAIISGCLQRVEFSDGECGI